MICDAWHAAGTGTHTSVKATSSAEGRILVYYHVTAKGQYQDAIRQQMGAVLLSGLYRRVHAVYACVLGKSSEPIEAASQLLQSFGAKVKILETRQDAAQMERLTLTKLAQTVKPKDRVFYMHSKGISYEEDSELGMNAFWWTLFMEYHLLQGHARCTDLLRVYDLVGVKWENMQVGISVLFPERPSLLTPHDHRLLVVPPALGCFCPAVPAFYHGVVSTGTAPA